MDLAKERGVPIISMDEWLEFTQRRDGAQIDLCSANDAGIECDLKAGGVDHCHPGARWSAGDIGDGQRAADGAGDAVYPGAALCPGAGGGWLGAYVDTHSGGVWGGWVKGAKHANKTPALSVEGAQTAGVGALILVLLKNPRSVLMVLTDGVTSLIYTYSALKDILAAVHQICDPGFAALVSEHERRFFSGT